MGLVPEESLARTSIPRRRVSPGSSVAYFNLREGRFRQSNLHLAKPARIGNRQYIEDMYEHRYQKEFGHIARPGVDDPAERARRAAGSSSCTSSSTWRASRIATASGAIADALPPLRLPGGRRAGDQLPARTDYRFVITEVGGCAGRHRQRAGEYDVAELRFDEWSAAQAEKAERLYGAAAAPTGRSA